MCYREDILVGCCGFALARGRYFRNFRLVEIQQSFYEPPKIETARNWRMQAPSGFRFTLKAWQLITHEPTSPTYRRLRTPIDPQGRGNYGNFRPTPEVFRAWETTRKLAAALEAELVVFQCPASFRPTAQHIQNMRTFFGSISREGIRMVWEPRGDWPPDLVARLCEELELIHCVDPFHGLPAHGQIHYFRLHGITGYGYTFTDQDLKRLLSWCRDKKTYALFNNHSMAQDAMRFKMLLEKTQS